MSQIPEWYDDVGDGWGPILHDLHIKLLELDPDYHVDQIKEKFGGLRVYLRNEPDVVLETIRVAERRALKTCEYCGTQENVTTAGTPHWIKTLCDTCRESRIRNR